MTSSLKTCSIVNNVGRALVKKKVIILSSKEIETSNNVDIFNNYKDLYLSKRECEEKLLQAIQSEKGKVPFGVKKDDDTEKIKSAQENAIIKTLGKGFQYL